MRPVDKSPTDFLRAERGSVALIFGIAVIPLFMLAGGALDYSRASTMRSQFQHVADRAALAAAKASALRESDCILQNSTTGACSLTEIKAAGQAEGARFLNVEPTIKKFGTGNTVTLAKNDGVWSATVNYAGEMPTAMSKLVGISSIAINGSVTSRLSLGGNLFLDAHLLLDRSMSMGIGASADDISRMQALTGCAFGCHSTTSANKYYIQPKAQGIRFRIDDLRDATIALVTQVKALTGSNAQDHIRMGAYAFNHEVTPLVSLTSDLDQVGAAVQALDLPTADDGTQAKDALVWLNNLVPQSGDGLDASRPQQLVVLVTDGVEDGIYTGWQGMSPPTGLPLRWWDPSNPASQPNTGAFPVGECDALKSKGVTVAVIYTTYVPFVGTEQYDKLIGPFAANIQPNLQACATKGYFFIASNPGDIRNGMQQLFKKALVSSRLKLTN